MSEQYVSHLKDEGYRNVAVYRPWRALIWCYKIGRTMRTSKPKNIKNVSTAIILLVILIVIALASWFYLFQMSGESKQGEAYQNVTFTDALLKCRSFNEKRYGNKLKRLTFDSHSSRWEQQRGLYKIFFKADMVSNKAATTFAEYWAMCEISGRNGSVRDYDLLMYKSQKNEAQRANSGGLFGWP